MCRTLTRNMLQPFRFPSYEADGCPGWWVTSSEFILTVQVTFVAGTGVILLGYDQGVVSGLLTLPSFEAQFPQTAKGLEDPHSAVLQSLLIAICESAREDAIG